LSIWYVVQTAAETTGSPQHKLHWLAEQALSWSGLPVVTVRPTVFLEGFFLRLAAAGLVDGPAVHLRQRALEPGVHQRAEGVGKCDRVGATGFG